MISKEEHIVIFTLHEQGYSIRAISRITGISRRTVSKRLQQNKLEPYKKRNYSSILDPYKEYIIKRYKETLPNLIPCSVLLREIQEYGYKGQIRIIQRYLKTLKTNISTNQIPKQDIRFETDKGYQAQADWTTIRNGKNPIYAFVMVLGYSRYAFVYFTNNMSQSTWQDCHIKAFEYFGGIPQVVLYDNLKSVVIQRDKYGINNHGFIAKFMDFTKGLFIPKLCKPHRPKTKGKVERFNSYLKGNFYNPLKSKKFVCLQQH